MQKFIDITVLEESIRVNYLDNEKENLPVLLFIHGNSSSKESFISQIIELSKSYRVIAPDLLGHGGTSKLSLNKYSLKSLCEFLIQFVKELSLEVHCVLGHSLGGHLALQTLNQISPLKLVLWGTPPMTNPPAMEKLFQENPLLGYFFQEDVENEELEKLYYECFNKDSQYSVSSFTNDFLKTDSKFRSELISELGTLEFKDELDELEKFSGEVLFILGENEKIIRNEYIRHNCLDYFQSQSKNSSHFIHCDSPESFNMKILNYLQTATIEPPHVRLEL